ncbi:nuclear transport factor 2 family protein [Micromonospora sp. NPDC049679]|uniref:nuclear transport factor 2 family protein n=1 Tax=Micromonospora sp. NPDC049679 TaxID=3155920 RepID=UPI0033E9679E
MADTEALRAVVRDYFAAIDANDIEKVLRLFHEGAVYERPGYEAIRGKDELRRFYTEKRVIATGSHDVAGILVEGTQATAWGSFAGRSHARKPLEERWCDVYGFLGVQIAYRRTHFFRPAV